MQVKKQQLEPDMEQKTGSKLGKEYVKGVYCHPACLTDMQWNKHIMHYAYHAKCPDGWDAWSLEEKLWQT